MSTPLNPIYNPVATEPAPSPTIRAVFKTYGLPYLVNKEPPPLNKAPPVKDTPRLKATLPGFCLA